MTSSLECPAFMQLPATEAIPEGLPGRWWVAHTKPRQEKALARNLQTLGIFSYLPLQRRVTRSANTGRVSRSFAPLFTGYLFLNGMEEQRHRALKTNRIVNMLDVADQAELVGQLRQVHRVLVTETEFRLDTKLRVGDWVRVVAGPLLGVEGVVCRRLSRPRLALNVRMLGQSIIVEVPPDMLERIDRPTYGGVGV